MSRACLLKFSGNSSISSSLLEEHMCLDQSSADPGAYILAENVIDITHDHVLTDDVHLTD